MLAFKNVTVAYGSTQVLKDASFQASPKDCVCIVGASGSGKSTIAKLLVRVLDPDDGVVMVDGADLKAVPPGILQLFRRRVGIIFQEPMLLEHASVRENIALPLELFDAPEATVKRNVDDLLKRCGLKAKANVRASELSTSEQSVVAIARSLVAGPMVIVADEPLLHLDDQQKKIVVDLLKAMQQHGTTLIILSRDDATANAFGAKTLTLEGGKLSQPLRKKAITDSPKPADTHRILEQEQSAEQPATPSEATPEPEDVVETQEKDTAKSSKKKIRITSIGSNLQ